MTADLLRLRAVLGSLFPDSSQVHRVLNLGCGAFPSASVLRALFPAARLIGLDRELYALSPQPETALIAAVGAYAPFAPTARFDLLLVRHPDVDRDPAGWQRVAATLPAWLSSTGRLLVSGYAAHEVDTLRAILLVCGLRECPLPARLPAVDLAGRDRVLFACAPPASACAGGLRT